MAARSADLRIEPLGPSHERAGFHCGTPPLDTFLHRLAGQYERRNLGRTFVLVRSDSPRILGYHTLASGAVAFANLPRAVARRLPRHPVPAVLLARLAADGSVRGQGHGERLLIDALERSLALSESLGVHVVEVHARDDGARAFYRRYGFEPLLDDARHLYMPIRTVARALDG